MASSTTLKLNKKENVSIVLWINGAVFADKSWKVSAKVKDDDVYIFMKDPTSSNQLKMKISEYDKFEEIPEDKSKNKKATKKSRKKPASKPVDSEASNS